MREKNIALIGSGPNGTGFVRGLVNNLKEKLQSGEITTEQLQQWHLHIFEKSTLIGPGFPYD